MIRRTTAILATTGLVALGAMAPATAQEPAAQLSSYGASSYATALEISLTDQSLAASHTTASVTSSPAPKALANGAALLLAGTAIPGEAPVEATEGQDVTDSTSACPVDLNPLTEALAGSGLTIDVACVTTNAKVPNGAPSARSESGELTISIQGLAEGALAPLGDALEQVLGQLLPPGSDAVEQLCESPLGILCDTIEEITSIDVQALVDEIFADLLEVGDGTFTLAEVFVAPTLSTASASSAGVDAAAGSGAVTITLFPGLQAAIEAVTGLVPGEVAPDSLLTVEIGQATASVHRDPITGEAAPDASAAQLLSASATDNLGILDQLLSVEVPGLLDSLTEAAAALSCDGGALADVLCVDLGAVNELDEAELTARNLNFGAGTVGREASAASIHVLPILGEQLGAPLLSVALAEAAAAANAVPAQPLPSPAPEAPRGDAPLPRTGGEAALPLALGLLAVAALGGTLLRRTRSV
jgi:hypothetical protein